MNRFVRRSRRLADVTFASVLRSETHAPLEGAEGHGCRPFGSDFECDEWCTYKGYRGGYCSWGVVCTCYGG